MMMTTTIICTASTRLMNSAYFLQPSAIWRVWLSVNWFRLVFPSKQFGWINSTIKFVSGISLQLVDVSSQDVSGVESMAAAVTRIVFLSQRRTSTIARHRSVTEIHRIREAILYSMPIFTVCFLDTLHCCIAKHLAYGEMPRRMLPLIITSWSCSHICLLHITDHVIYFSIWFRVRWVTVVLICVEYNMCSVRISCWQRIRPSGINDVGFTHYKTILYLRFSCLSVPPSGVEGWYAGHHAESIRVS